MNLRLYAVTILSDRGLTYFQIMLTFFLSITLILNLYTYAVFVDIGHFVLRGPTQFKLSTINNRTEVSNFQSFAIN